MNVGLWDLEVDAVVKALPDEEAPDVAAARQPIFVHVDPEQAAVSFVVDPLLVPIAVTCADKTCRLNTESPSYCIFYEVFVIVWQVSCDQVRLLHSQVHEN